MTAEEKTASLHQKMKALCAERERRATSRLGAVCVGLSLCLVMLVFGGASHGGGAIGLYSGTTMLFESAGAFVLVAVIAFLAGVVVTVLCTRSAGNERNER